MMISVRNLEFAYSRSEGDVLKNINFHVEPGEIFGFLGPSGAGKSTLQKILIGFESGYRGNAIVNGTEISKRGSDFFEDVGVQFESPGFYGRFTARENLNLFSALFGSRCEDPAPLMKSLGLGGDMDRKVEAYSKGMRIRLDFIRSLLHSPKVLFLDEPTAGLDPFHLELVLAEIRRRKEQGVTILLSTHDMDVVRRLCDRVAFLSGGTIRAIDTPRNLMLGRTAGTFCVEYKEGEVLHNAEFSLDRPGGNEEFLALAKKYNFETIHSQEPSLGEVFVSMTGEDLS